MTVFYSNSMAYLGRIDPLLNYHRISAAREKLTYHLLTTRLIDVLQPWVISSYYKSIDPVVARTIPRTPPADGVGATSERPACTELVERCAPNQLS